MNVRKSIIIATCNHQTLQRAQTHNLMQFAYAISVSFKEKLWLTGLKCFALIEPNLESNHCQLYGECFCTLYLSSHFEILQQIKNDNAVWQLDLQAPIAENMFKRQNLLTNSLANSTVLSWHNRSTFWCTQRRQIHTFFNCMAPGLFFRIALKILPPS